MSRAPWTVRALTVTFLLLLACAGACASDRDEREAAESSQRVDAESPADLPFAVAGTMTAPPTKLAVISMIGPEGRAGTQMLAGEGAVVAEYRVVSIHPGRVVFERDGLTFFVRVGAEHQDAPARVAPPPHARRRTAPPAVVAPPANLEEIRRQSRAFIERLKANPELHNGLEETVRRAREKGAASQ
jgi:hypothetical protein